MRISNLVIRNFRSFSDRGDIISISEMAAFVGKNSSGKSNILQALQVFWGQAALTEADFYYGDTSRTVSITVIFKVSQDDLVPVLLPYVSPEGILQLRRDYTIDNLKGKLYVLGRNEFSGVAEMNPCPARKLTAGRINAFLTSEQSGNLRRFAQQAGKVIDEQSFYDTLGQYWCVHIAEYPSLWVYGDVETDNAAQKSIMAELPPYYYLPVSYTTEKLTQDKHSYFQQIYQQILGDVTQLLAGARVERLRHQVDMIYRSSGMKKRCSDVNQLLLEIGGADASVKMHIEIGEPNYAALFHPAPILRINDGYDCDVQSKGQGIQRDAIFRLLRVFSKLNRKRQRNFILAVDEPEAFMHPTYKRSLFKSFVNLCETGCQVLYTTHDPAFVSVSRFDDIHTVVMKREAPLYSSVFSCSFSELMQKTVFSRSFRGKNEDAVRKELAHKCQGEQNEGFFADRIILVEGATERYALPVYFSKLGYDLDENNTVILQAQSKTLLKLLFVIFSSCQIPCYCIFDGDKPDDENYTKYRLQQRMDEEERKRIENHARLNRELLELLKGVPQEFPDTTVGKYYTVWERDFEHAVQMRFKSYEELRNRIVRQEGVQGGSKPLIAYHMAVNGKLSDLPDDVRGTLIDLIGQMKNVECLTLEDAPVKSNVFTLLSEATDESIPVFASAAGRNTIAEDDTPIGYAAGVFPPGTSFLVHIQGDSMANQIPDSCYVAVKRTEEVIAPGAIGIFIIEGGEMVCKQYIAKKTGERVLKSLNREYPDIPITENQFCQIRGEVIMLGRKKPAIYFVE